MSGSRLSYQVLARKWRPQSFEEVTGQSHVITALRNAIRTGRVPQALLLTGMRGVGKTTLARLIARCLNCDSGPTDTPCGECPTCREITAGTSTDVQEIDAASRTSVDDVRELIEAIQYAPSPGKYRIYVVDEVHMLSTPAFNALLKTLEEPPPRSLFVFATTNPEKIPFTVLSRCQRYDLRRIATSTIVERLKAIANAEGIRISDASLLAIAREGDGSMRDSMTLLDQVIAFGGEEIRDEQVAEVLDLLDRRILIAIIEACIDANAQAAIEACARAADSGVDAKRLGAELLQVLRDLVVLRTVPKNDGLVEGSDAEVAALRALAERTDETRLRRMFRALLKEQEDLAWAPQPMAVLEMAVIRMATMASGDDVARLLSRLEKLERLLVENTGTLSAGSGAVSTRKSVETSTRPASPRTSNTPKTKNLDEHQEDSDDEPAPVADQHKNESRAMFTQTAREQNDGTRHSRSTTVRTQPSATDEPLPALLKRFAAFAQKENHLLFGILEKGNLLECSSTQFRVALPDCFETKRLISKNDEFETLCTKFFERPLRAVIETIAASTPAPRRGVQSQKDAKREALRAQRQEALNHPVINAALEIFGGEVVEIRNLDGDT